MIKTIKKEFEFILITLIGIFIIAFLIYKYTGYALPFFFGFFGFVLLVFTGPKVCFAFYFATTFFVPERIYIDYPITYNQVFGVLYLSSFFLWYFKKLPKLPRKGFFKILIIILIYFIINSLMGEDFGAGINSIVYLILYFIICLTIVLQFSNPQNIKHYFWIILLVTSLAAFVGLIEFVTGIDLFAKNAASWGGYRRINAMSKNAIVYGSYLIFAYPIGYYLFCQTKTVKLKFLSLFLTIFCVIISLFTFSRQIYIYLFASFAAIAIFMRNKYSKLFVVVVIVLGLLSSVYIGRFLLLRFTTASKHQRDISVTFRLDGVKITKNVLKQKPLTGIGLGSYPTVWQNYVPDDTLLIQYFKGIKRYPDFGYNQILVEGGIIGFLLSIFMFIYIIIFLLKEWKKAKLNQNQIRLDYIGILIVLMVIFLLENMIQDTFLSIRTWLMYALILALENDKFLINESKESKIK